MTNKILEMALERQKYCDAEVLKLCEIYGFGAVMDSAASQWAKRDPEGALTIGPPASCDTRRMAETGNTDSVRSTGGAVPSEAQADAQPSSPSPPRTLKQ